MAQNMSHLPTPAPNASQHNSDMPEVPDLTDFVTRTEDYCFAFGAGSGIYKGMLDRDSSGSQEPVALKVFQGRPDYAKRKRQFVREIRVWTTVNHPNITPFLGISSEFEGLGFPCLISPYYENGDITAYLKEHRDVEKLPLITQITKGLSYLHENSIIHGDLKGSNVLINDVGEACLTDFGLSRILKETGFTTKSLACTLRFTAPELFNMRMPCVTEATDVWAFAMTVIEIMSERIPFPDEPNDPFIILLVHGGGRPERQGYPEINDEVWGMIQQCWVTEPNLRPTVATLLGFFKSLKNISG